MITKIFEARDHSKHPENYPFMIIDGNMVFEARDHSRHPENYPLLIIEDGQIFKARDHSRHPENYPILIIDGYYDEAILAAIIWECGLIARY